MNNSPVMFNTVRRMTDTNLTLGRWMNSAVRFGYSHSTMEGPALSPSYTIMKYNALLRQYERNGSDDFLGAVDWKPSPATKITFEMQVNHYKSDTSFTLDPNGFLVQEADGTPAYLGNFTSFTPYGGAGHGGLQYRPAWAARTPARRSIHCFLPRTSRVACRSSILLARW